MEPQAVNLDCDSMTFTDLLAIFDRTLIFKLNEDDLVEDKICFKVEFGFRGGLMLVDSAEENIPSSGL